MTLCINGYEAKPGDRWKMRNGEYALIGAIRQAAEEGHEIIGWDEDDEMCHWNLTGDFFNSTDEDEKDLIAPQGIQLKKYKDVRDILDKALSAANKNEDLNSRLAIGNLVIAIGMIIDALAKLEER